jgi:hypothetical protein
MKRIRLSKTWGAAAAVAVAAVVGVGLTVKDSIGSDHQQTALTELHPRLDLTDVWVFPGSSDDRLVLAATIASPIHPSANDRASFFDPNALYQIHVDNTQDGGADVVFQFSFDQLMNGGQTFDVIGPANVRRVGEDFPGPLGLLPGGARYKFSTGAPMMMRQRLNDANIRMDLPNNQGEMRVFAGLRDDPFYIDLPRFFSIDPFADRRPTTTALSDTLNLPEATTFRPQCDANGQPIQDATNLFFNFDQGCATDFLRGLNALAIVVEVPEAVLTQGRGGADPVIGVWATISR